MRTISTGFQVALWAYPWDQTGLGVEAFLDALEEAGARAVSMATSYHAGLILTPHHPQHRLYFAEDGVLYFRPAAAKVEKLALRPRLSSMLEGEEPLRELISGAERRGMEVKAWFVCTHNTALGVTSPELVVRNAYGDPLYFALCPAQEGVADYLVTLLEDLAAAHAIAAIDLESLGFLGLPHGYHHEKDLVGLTRSASFLLSLCFCPACLHRAASAGVDGVLVRKLVKEKLEAFFRGELAEGEVLLEEPEFTAYLETRVGTVMGLLRRIRESVRQDCRLHLIEWTSPDQWLLGGFDLSVGNWVDGMIMCSYERHTHGLERLLTETREALPGTAVFGGIQAGYPTCTSREDIQRQLDAVKRAGGAGAQVYHFGMMSRRNLRWLGEAVGRESRV